MSAALTIVGYVLFPGLLLIGGALLWRRDRRREPVEMEPLDFRDWLDDWDEVWRRPPTVDGPREQTI
jgi:hypothetical protein